jgi:glyoxylate/hydroxypyruvate reductase A
VDIVFASQIETPESWLPRLRRALPADRFFVWPECGDRERVEVALVGEPPRDALATFPNLKLIQSLWMGVDGLLADPTLPRAVPLARMVDAGMVAAMAETVLVHVLDWHRHLYRYREHQADGVWKRHRQYMACDRTVGLLGLGALGSEAARRLLLMGFKVCGWSRRPKRIEGVECFSDLGEVLKRSQALVCLLPLTAQTRCVLNASAFAAMPEHSCVINIARGAHVVEADLLAALDSGHLAHAYLDVFETEPLPEAHPFWHHPKVTLTPHCAALTEPRTAVPVLVENIERVRRGEPALNLVDPSAGY